MWEIERWFTFPKFQEDTEYIEKTLKQTRVERRGNDRGARRRSDAGWLLDDAAGLGRRGWDARNHRTESRRRPAHAGQLQRDSHLAGNVERPDAARGRGDRDRRRGQRGVARRVRPGGQAGADQPQPGFAQAAVGGQEGAGRHQRVYGKPGSSKTAGSGSTPGAMPAGRTPRPARRWWRSRFRPRRRGCCAGCCRRGR